jgi:putative hydrolase of HD superfamily
LPYAKTELNGNKVIKMLLLHDVVEIDTGDKFAYDANHLDTENETLAAKRIFSLLPKTIGENLLALWMEFEHSSSPEALFAKGVDRVIPVMQNLQNNGGSWLEHGISAEQILSKNAGVENVNSELWALIKTKVRALQSKGVIT